MEEDPEEGPCDTDSTISGISPDMSQRIKDAESDTGNEAGRSKNGHEQDPFGLRRRDRQRILEALVLKGASSCCKMRQQSSEQHSSEDRGRKRVR